MNVKFKSALAVAALALGASAAQASIPAGDIVFSVWNNVNNNAGYTFDTGLNANTWNPAVAQTFSLGAAAVAAFNGTPSNAQWNIFAANSAGNLLTSVTTNNLNSLGANAGDADFNVQAAVSGAGTYYQAMTSGDVSSSATAVWANSMSQGGGQLADPTDKVGAGTVWFETLSSADATATLFSGTWTLAFIGAAGSATAATLTWNPTSTTVPLPAAVWLLGSGLMGLAGVGRRRKVTAA